MPGNSRSTIMETLQESLPAPRTVDSIDTDVMPVSTSSLTTPEEIPVEQIPMPEEAMDLNPEYLDNKLQRCDSTPAAAAVEMRQKIVISGTFWDILIINTIYYS